MKLGRIRSVTLAWRCTWPGRRAGRGGAAGSRSVSKLMTIRKETPELSKNFRANKETSDFSPGRLYYPVYRVQSFCEPGS